MAGGRGRAATGAGRARRQRRDAGTRHRAGGPGAGRSRAGPSSAGEVDAAAGPHRSAGVTLSRDAHGRSGQAVQLFRGLGDAIGECGALSTLAHAATCLGRNEEAVEAALISVRLAQTTATPGQQAMLFNYPGVAYLWSRAFDKARSALEHAVKLAEASGGAVGAFQPLINQLLNEALQAVSIRYQYGTLPSLEGMVSLHERCEGLVRQGQAAGLFVGAQIISAAAAVLTSALFRVWTAELGLAQFATPTLAHAFEHWVRAELAWAEGDRRQAAAHCALMVDMARQLEYEQMTCLGHLLLSQIHEQLDEPKQ